jgi:23S rRNA (adenine2503-C2)-methyltransferase
MVYIVTHREEFIMHPLFEKEPLCYEDTAQNVWKYIFHFDGAIAEAVLYRYKSFEDRTVLCISVQSGCPVGCTFCGTGKKFIRNLLWDEILVQVQYIIYDKNIDVINCKKLQIMFMSMGEPFLNYQDVSCSIGQLSSLFPSAQLLVSTIAPRREYELKDFISISRQYNMVGLQFSIHSAFDYSRNLLIPFKDKLSLIEIRDYGIEWWNQTGKKVYLNYCVSDSNAYMRDFTELRKLFPPNVFCFTFSVICSKDETMLDAGYRNLDKIREFEKLFINQGYDTRIFDPAGQDTIGGGCGQLFYVQEWLKNKK